MLETEKKELLHLIRTNWQKLSQESISRKSRLNIWNEIVDECKSRGHQWCIYDETKDGNWLSGTKWPKFKYEFRKKCERYNAMEKKTGRNYTDRFTGCDLIISEILSMSDANYQSEPRENETVSQSQSPLTELVYDDDNDTGNQLYQNTEALALIGSLCAENDYKDKHQSGYNPSSKLIHFHGPNEVSQPAQTSFYADKQNEQSEQSNISLLNETSTEKIEEPESDLLNVEYGEGSWWRYFSRTGCIATCLICGLQINRGLRFSTSPLSYHMAKRHPELFATIRFHRAATNKWDPLQNPTTSQAIPVRSTLSSACAHKYQNSNGKRPHNSANANEASAYQPEDLNNSNRNSNTFAWMNDENMLFGRIVALRLKSLDSRKRMMVKIAIEELFDRYEQNTEEVASSTSAI